MSAIDNTNLKNYRDDIGTTGFTPAVDYVYDPNAKTVTVDDDSVIPSGDTYSKTRLRVCDEFGGEVRGTITAQATPVVLDISTLNLSGELKLTATVITANNLVADGVADIDGLLVGVLAFWDKQKNAKA